MGYLSSPNTKDLHYCVYSAQDLRIGANSTARPFDSSGLLPLGDSPSKLGLAVIIGTHNTSIHGIPNRSRGPHQSSKIRRVLASSSISKMTKSAGKKNLHTLTNRFSTTP
ncbi:hypothetical protein PIB30_092727 [Stylosanthes scabra]|uniref:Uncharacterized protein n=1 Tax=Stylosanthes scabra TaxID=79078 RepID=A0ABU6RV76_9FABA|nr:hypothetical protein [Stylosanthes scabra]